ncbi:Low temperature viability protein [Macrophomina phaseolina MS6]|uniref:Low temperature viability protein n=2 Tax=Macrophomina phaseolina TaxID=35725 RepID=K2RM45_MACPH|nr:Low temperature viability protein [Macrophomina phaseolina MS6]
MVFAEVAAPNTNKNRHNRDDASSSSSASARGGKVKSRRDLESEFADRVRANEGEAANYGIFYDDSEYDYMQHLRDMGASGDATFIPAKGKEAEQQRKGKGKMRLEDMLAGMAVDEDGRSEADVSVSSTASSSAAELFGEDLAPSEFYRKGSYQDQQDVPDAIAGFQPDMDPRLREVLEALEDEAYVEDEDDIFNELAKDRQEVDPQTWEMMGDFVDDEDDGWATDDTVKADNKTKFEAPPSPTGAVSEEGVKLPPAEGPAGGETDDHGDGDWMAEFSKFKKDAKAQKAQKKVGAPSDLQSFVTGASSVTGGRHKKRKGALTSTSNYSMTSSALQRTDQLSLLDERFEKYEQEYADDGYGADDNMSMMSGMTGMSGMSGLSVYSKASTSSQAPGLRSDFDSILDEFSSKNGHIKRGKKHNGYKDGLAQLDEIRKGLGPARLKQSSKAR